MSSENKRQRNYSPDEMISRLQASRGGSKVRGEEREVDEESGMVTVRRRKRRRTGKGKADLSLRDPKWFRLLKRVTFIGFPVVAVLVIALYVVVSASVETEGFRRGLGETLAKQMGLAAPLKLEGTRLNTTSLSVGRATGEGNPGSPLRAFTFEGTDFRLGTSSFFGGDWDVAFCTVQNGMVRLGRPAPATAATAAEPLRLAGFMLSPRPGSITFREVAVWDGMVLFGEAEPEKGPGLRNVRADFSRREEGGGVFYEGQFTGVQNGTLELKGWPVFGVDTIRVRFDGDQVDIMRSRLSLGEQGVDAPLRTLEAKGTIPALPGRTASLTLDALELPLEELLPPTVDRLVKGDKLSAEGLALTWNTSDPAGSWKIEGKARVQVVQMREDLRIISVLRGLTSNELQGLDLVDCQFDLEMSPEGTVIRNIQGAATSKAQVSGDLRVSADGRIDGQFRLGLAQDLLLGRIPPFLETGLGAEIGYFWADIEVGGLVSAPIDDFSARVRAWQAGGGGLREAAAPRPAIPGLLPPPDGEEDLSDRKRMDRWNGLFRNLTEEEEEGP